MDFKATDTAQLTRLSKRSGTVIYRHIRREITQWCEQIAPIRGTVEIDESYLGPQRIRGKCSRGAEKRLQVFKREGNVYTEIISNAKKPPLQRVILGKISPDSVIHTDIWSSYDD